MIKGTFKIHVLGPSVNRMIEGEIQLKGGGEEALPTVAVGVLNGIIKDQHLLEMDITSLKNGVHRQQAARRFLVFF